MDGNRARAVLYHPDHGNASKEHAADLIIVAAGGLESARLLLLSAASGPHREGLGNASGQVGRNLGFHHIWRGFMRFKARTMPGRAGPPTMLSHQFAEPPAPSTHGGLTVELPDSLPDSLVEAATHKHWRNGAELVEALRPVTHSRSMVFNGESRPGPGKYAALSKKLADRFGDPFLHVHYELDDFDRATHLAAQGIAMRIGTALEAESVTMDDVTKYWSAHHHLGTCRMGSDARESVVDSFGAVHAAQGLYVCGGSTFTTPTAFQPTLTMVALAIRTARKIAETLRG
jgi:choline dehydrogenase-like flavoprotein